MRELALTLSVIVDTDATQENTRDLEGDTL